MVLPGEDITYTVNVTNNGPKDAPNVYVLDFWFPGTLTYDSATTSTGNVSRTLPDWFTDLFSSSNTSMFSGSTLTWNIGDLPSGESANMTMVATANESLLLSPDLGGLYYNMAFVIVPQPCLDHPRYRHRQ